VPKDAIAENCIPFDCFYIPKSSTVPSVNFCAALGQFLGIIKKKQFVRSYRTTGRFWLTFMIQPVGGVPLGGHSNIALSVQGTKWHEYLSLFQSSNLVLELATADHLVRMPGGNQGSVRKFCRLHC
jgi:hypothetical protein